MKRYTIALCIAAMIFCSIVSCDENEEKTAAPSSSAYTLVRLDDKTMVNFLSVLPEIIRFSKIYHSSLSAQELNAKNAELLYFDALKRDPLIQSMSVSNGFSNAAQVLDVYRSVLAGYQTLKSITNDFETTVMNFKSQLESEIASLKVQLDIPNISYEEKAAYQYDMDSRLNALIILDNMRVMKKFEKQMDAIDKSAVEK